MRRPPLDNTERGICPESILPNNASFSGSMGPPLIETFHTLHIFEAARENGASESMYLGVPVLVVQPLKRDKGISDDVRWLAFIDSQIAVFGTTSMVHEELGRYLARSPADTWLMWRISRLRSTDQSWCVLISAVYRRELVRRTLTALDPVLVQQPDHTEDGLVMGIHFGRRVEIDYERIRESGNPEESQTRTQHEVSQPATPVGPPMASHLFSSRDTISHKVILFS